MTLILSLLTIKLRVAKPTIITQQLAGQQYTTAVDKNSHIIKQETCSNTTLSCLTSTNNKIVTQTFKAVRTPHDYRYICCVSHKTIYDPLAVIRASIIRL